MRGMLRELSVQNLALIEDVRVELHPGFCAWTGETGAGKSLLLGALGLLLGERGSADVIRTGADELRVTGRFELNRPEQREFTRQILQTDVQDDDLILTRRLSRSGRSSALVNDVPVAVATLRRIGEMLVDVHGQRESYSLLQPAYQLELLDAFGKLTDQRAKYVAAADKVRGLRKTYRELSEAKQTRQRELSLVRFERDDLDAAKLVPGELPAISKERETLVHARSPGRVHRHRGEPPVRRRRVGGRSAGPAHQGRRALVRPRPESWRRSATAWRHCGPRCRTSPRRAATCPSGSRRTPTAWRKSRSESSS